MRIVWSTVGLAVLFLAGAYLASNMNDRDQQVVVDQLEEEVEALRSDLAIQRQEMESLRRERDSSLVTSDLLREENRKLKDLASLQLANESKIGFVTFEELSRRELTRVRTRDPEKAFFYRSEKGLYYGQHGQSYGPEAAKMAKELFESMCDFGDGVRGIPAAKPGSEDEVYWRLRKKLQDLGYRAPSSVIFSPNSPPAGEEG